MAVGKTCLHPNAWPLPRSKSAPISSGSFDFACKLIVQNRRRIRLAFHDSQRRTMRNIDEAADVEIGHIVHDLPVRPPCRGRQTSVIRGEEQLADLSSAVILRSVVSTQAVAAATILSIHFLRSRACFCGSFFADVVPL